MTPVPASTRFYLPWLLSSLVLISAGLYNGFPLVTSDSGAYINSAITHIVPADRPIVYGLFIQATGLYFSLWLVILAQGLLLGWLLLRCVAAFAPRIQTAFGQLFVLGVVTWISGVSWYCSQLMPDIFAAIGLLCLALLLLGRFKSRGSQVALLALLLLATLVHNSHLLTNSLVVLAFGIVAYWQRLFKRGLVQWTHWLVATTTVLSSWLLLPTIHAGFGGGFTLSRASPAFLVARLCETGILEEYLNQSCEAGSKYKLCAFRDKLPNDAITFMWDGGSPYNQTGGLEANRSECQQIVRGILTSPQYYPQLASEAMQATLRQLTHIGYGDGLVPFRENTNPYWKVQEFTGYELKEYLSSRQNRNLLTFDTLNERTYAVQLLAVLLISTLVLWHSQTSRHSLNTQAGPTTGTNLLLLLTIIGLGLLGNAFATGALANVLDRLQGRVAWLLPFVAVLMVAQFGSELLHWQRRQVEPPADTA